MAETKKSDYDIVQEMFEFLQGHNLAGHVFDGPHPLSLTADQAWLVIHYVQNIYRTLSDSIERCGVCGDLFDSRCEGEYDEELPPYSFCDSQCMQEASHASD